MCWPWSTSSPAALDVLALVYELTGAALDVLVMVDELTGFHKSGPMSSMRPTSWGSARNRRARTGREAVEMAGVVLGYRAIWHDRGPGGRHDFSGRSRGRGPTTRSRPELHQKSEPSYIISALLGSIHLTVTDHRRPLPSGVGMYDGSLGIVMICFSSSYGPSPPIPTHPLLSSGSGAGLGCG